MKKRGESQGKGGSPRQRGACEERVSSAGTSAVQTTRRQDIDDPWSTHTGGPPGWIAWV